MIPIYNPAVITSGACAVPGPEFDHREEFMSIDTHHDVSQEANQLGPSPKLEKISPEMTS